MIMQEPRYRYSIIIPHYNIPTLLKRCLSTIPHREDLQIIVVDDKSTDENLEKLKVLEKEYRYVEFVYSKTNGGGGKARNTGLQYAKGEYVFFADGDDFFNYCIIKILDEYQYEDADMVFFNATHIDTETYLPTLRVTTLQSALRQYEKSNNLDVFRYVFGEPWCKMIRRQIIVDNDIKFDEIPIHNDTRFSYLVGYYARQVKFDNRALYCLADRKGSVSKGLSDEKVEIRTQVFARKNRFLMDHNIHFFDDTMILPFWNYMKRLDVKNFSNCLSITREYGFSSNFVLCKLIRFIIMIIILRNKM